MSRNDVRAWKSRPLLGRAIRAAVFLAPIVVSIVVAMVASAVMPTPTTLIGVIVWWTAFLIAITLPMVFTSKLVRKILPLAALFELTLVFPDEAPSRFAVAKAAGRTRDLKKQLAEPHKHAPNEMAALVLALISSLGEHDRLTRGHSERVRAFTDMLAEQVGVPKDDREKLRWAALLHDIGKLEVSQEILNKPGRPDDDEWAVLKRHPQEGTRILGSLRDWLGSWSGAVTHHHEKWDGSGYALGLKGEEISLGGRILAIADSYEVMTAARPYKKPMPPEAARRELAKCAGTHFDPALVRAFLEISMGRVWRTVGAAALIAQLPILSGLSYKGITQRLGRSAATVAATTAAVGGLVLGGGVDVPHHERAPQVVAAEPSASDAPNGNETKEADQQEGSSTSSEKDQPEGSGGALGSSSSADGATAQQGGDDPVTPDDRPDDRPSPPPDDPGQSHPEPFVAEGDISLATPLNPTVGSATEADFLANCDVPSSQGVDAWVFAIDADVAHYGPANLTGSSGVGSPDLVTRAYDGSCKRLDEYAAASFSFPVSSRYLVVIAPRGVRTRLSLRIGG